jgi:hypothetical protein
MTTKLATINTDLPTRLPRESRIESYLVDETFLMEQQRRKLEQHGHSRLAKVHVCEHTEPSRVVAEGELQNNILPHPDLNTQKNAGISPNLNPEPPLSDPARTQFDNERREQEKDKQLRLGLALNMRTAPEPRPS